MGEVDHVRFHGNASYDRLDHSTQLTLSVFCTLTWLHKYTDMPTLDASLIDEMLCVHFDGVWETAGPIFLDLLTLAESWLDRPDEYHTTQVMTMLMAFRSIATTIHCHPSDNVALAQRYEHIASRLVAWFEARADAQAAKRSEWEMFAKMARRLTNWEGDNPDWAS